MYIRLAKCQQWHLVTATQGCWCKVKCGRDYDLGLCEQRESLEECEGKVCSTCRGIPRRRGSSLANTKEGG